MRWLQIVFACLAYSAVCYLLSSISHLLSSIEDSQQLLTNLFQSELF
jgi:hypothetical protein